MDEVDLGRHMVDGEDTVRREERAARMERTEGGAGWMERTERTGWMYRSQAGPGLDEEA